MKHIGGQGPTVTRQKMRNQQFGIKTQQMSSNGYPQAIQGKDIMARHAQYQYDQMVKKHTETYCKYCGHQIEAIPKGKSESVDWTMYNDELDAGMHWECYQKEMLKQRGW